MIGCMILKIKKLLTLIFKSHVVWLAHHLFCFVAIFVNTNNGCHALFSLLHLSSTFFFKGSEFNIDGLCVYFSLFHLVHIIFFSALGHGRIVVDEHLFEFSVFLVHFFETKSPDLNSHICIDHVKENGPAIFFKYSPHRNSFLCIDVRIIVICVCCSEAGSACLIFIVTRMSFVCLRVKGVIISFSLLFVSQSLVGFFYPNKFSRIF